ncbi:MAG: carbonic anhydrase family protein [Betaproteobacteria bacterium]
MKRTLFDLLLVIALGAAAAFGWMRYQAGAGVAAQVAELTPKTVDAVTKLAEAEKSLEELQEQLTPLREQAEQLTAYRSAFANGEALRDLETVYKKEKGPLRPERQLGLGTLRLLTKGEADPAAVDAFKKALDTADWGTRKQVICAAQNALASAGQKIEVLSSCQNQQAQAKSDKAEAKPADAHAPAAGAKAEDSHAQDAHAGKPAHDDKTAAERRLEEAAGKKKDAKAPSTLPPWAYEGPLGPESWGERYAMCGRGRNQSPINLAGPLLRVKYELIQDFRAGPLAIVNDGKTWQVNVAPGSKMRIDSMPYDLISLTFQRPSGEQIDGKSFPMGIHMLHRDKSGKLVTVVVLVREGNENPGIKLLWSHAPAKEGPEIQPEGVTFNPANLLPRELNFLTYDGSLTAPPCSENMRYFVLKEPINISREQLMQYPFKISSRPVQPQNGRPIASN